MRSILAAIAWIALMTASVAADVATQPLIIEPPRLNPECIRLQPVGEAALAVTGNCLITLEIFSEADPIVWYKDGVEVHRGPRYEFAPVNTTNQVVISHRIRATGVKFVDEENITGFQSDVITVEVGRSTGASLEAPQQNGNFFSTVVEWVKMLGDLIESVGKVGQWFSRS